MENNLYLFREIEAYPWELEKAVEALNYALSYEPENVQALCLMAKVKYEQLGEIEDAKELYQKALTLKMELPNIYPDYLRLLVNAQDYEEAQNLIDYAIKVKGVDKATIKLYQAYIFEALEEFEKAENALQEAKMFALNDDFISFAESVLSRISKKRKIKSNEVRKKEEVEKKEQSTPVKNWLNDRLNNLL